MSTEAEAIGFVKTLAAFERLAAWLPLGEPRPSGVLTENGGFFSEEAAAGYVAACVVGQDAFLAALARRAPRAARAPPAEDAASDADQGRFSEETAAENVAACAVGQAAFLAALAPRAPRAASAPNGGSSKKIEAGPPRGAFGRD